MRVVRNDKGIVLVTTLLLTLLTLAIILSLLYMVTAGTKASGIQKRYRTAVEASYGGTDILTKAVIPFVMQNYSSSSLLSKLTGNSGFSSVGLQVQVSQSCLQSKLTKSTASWGACSNQNLTAPPSKVPDLTFQMPSDAGNPFFVYAKIVDTKTGNTDMGGIQLEGSSVSEAVSVILPQHQPYLYKIEVQGQRQGDSSVSSDLEVLYAY